MKVLGKILSIILHPVWFPAAVIAYLIFVSSNPAVAIPLGKELQYFFIVAYSTILFPILISFLLWKLGFIQSMEMKTQKERYIPLISTMLFSFWVFWVYHQSLDAPRWMQIFLLAVFLTSVSTFMATIFKKASIHMSGAFSVFIFALLLNLSTAWQDLLLLLLAAILSIVVYLSRKGLKAHTHAELLIGAICGLVAQLIAFIIL